MIPATFRSLARLSRKYLVLHFWQSALMMLGITLGVAVVIAIDLANESAGLAFNLSTETISGRATHQITSGPGGIDERIFTVLRTRGIAKLSAPVIEEYVTFPQLDTGLMQLLGVDPFSEQPFRSYLNPANQSAEQTSTTGPLPEANLVPLLSQPGAILLSQEVAQRNSLEIGDQIIMDVGGLAREVTLAGILIPNDGLSKNALETLILTDIATAQELTGKLGKLDRIDLIIPSGELGQQIIADIQSFLPASAQLQTVQARRGSVEEMSSAFEVNLSALSMLALVVGLFLIYNTMTFSVVQRRPLFGILRSIGVTRREIFSMVVVEAFLIGVLGSTAGILLGIILGQGAIKLVTRTINDLFFVLTVQGVQIPTLSLLKGFTLGVAASVITSAPPAWEAASVPPRLALSRSGLESKAGKAIVIAASLGLLLLISGVFILLIPTRNLVISFTGTFAVVIGAAMLTPLATRWLIRLSSPPLGRLWGSLGRMAPRSVINSLSRTSIAVAALMVAVSVTIGVSLMVGSFRSTVIIWLDQTLQGDVYISSPGVSTTQTSVPIVEETLPIISNWNGVREIFTLRSVEVGSEYGQTHIAASSNPLVSTERIFQKTAIPPEEIPKAMADGAILVSEPYANRVNRGGNLTSVTLATDQGLIEFPIVAIYYDYSSTQGSVLMSLDTYRKYWNDNAITAVAAILEPGASPETIARQLRNRLANIQNLEIRPNSLLRSEVLDVFDRTFAITTALQLLATSVAFIGILSALLSLELERQREMGILKAIGLTSRQLWRLILLETGLLGGVAGILSMPTGYVLAVILIFIINRRSFGWTLQMQLLPVPFLQAFLIAITAALLAGIYPALRMSRTLASEAMRSE